MIEFAKLVNQGTDEQFAKEIGSYLDVDEFLRFLGATAILSNLDSLLSYIIFLLYRLLCCQTLRSISFWHRFCRCLP